MRKCSKCKIEKDESEFYKDNRSKSGLYSDCKDCHNELIKEYRKSEKYKIDSRKYRKNNPHIYKNNTDKLLKNKPDYFNNYQKERRIRDIKFRVEGNMKSAITTAVKGKKYGRLWESLVGYTAEDLIKHLEGKFKPWMNWDNYGKWHIDHIKPKSIFNYTCPEDKEFKECWALENLQPLEAMENMKKHNKYN